MKEEAIAQTLQLRKKIQDMLSYGNSLVQKTCRPKEFIQRVEAFSRQDKVCQERLRNFKRANEMQFASYVIKIIYTPNQHNAAEPDAVFQVILLSSEGDILCVQAHEKNFLIKAAFPQEQSRVICDGIVLQNLMAVDGQ